MYVSIPFKSVNFTLDKNDHREAVSFPKVSKICS